MERAVIPGGVGPEGQKRMPTALGVTECSVLSLHWSRQFGEREISQILTPRQTVRTAPKHWFLPLPAGRFNHEDKEQRKDSRAVALPGP